MRLIGKLKKQEEADTFAAYLHSQGIEHRIEVEVNKDWGDDDYGNPTFSIWVVEEDQAEEAERMLQEFLNNPQDKKFTELPSPPLTAVPPEGIQVETTAPTTRKERTGPITLYLLILCVWVFAWSILTMPHPEKVPNYLPFTPFVMSSVQKDFLYDYPHAYTILDEIINTYGAASLLTPDDLPTEGKDLLRSFFTTPYWDGFYPGMVQALQKNSVSPLHIHAPLFEKLREGEVWRLFTPCLLHGNLLHILFNMLWLIVLGRQMEKRMPGSRYLFFIIATGIFSNTCQYLMSGSNFVGISGVLCAMFAFIWMRQKIAPWEGYQLQNSTVVLLTAFILAMFGLQVYAFFKEVYFDQQTHLSIANTAHLSGAFIGLIFGRMNIFKWKR